MKRRPPAAVALVARTHWTVGGVIAVSTGLLHLVMRQVPQIEFGPRTYGIAGGMAAVYLLAGTLVWLGTPLAPVLSRVCTLLYLPRPGMGFRIWGAMSSPEFRAYFRRPRVEAGGAAPPGA